MGTMGAIPGSPLREALGSFRGTCKGSTYRLRIRDPLGRSLGFLSGVLQGFFQRFLQGFFEGLSKV